MSCYSSILSHIYIYTYTSTYELARLLIVQSLLLYAYGISYRNSLLLSIILWIVSIENNLLLGLGLGLGLHIAHLLQLSGPTSGR